MRQKIVLAALIFYATFAWAEATHAAGLTKPVNNLGLVAYWSFNEGNGSTATDFSGSGNTGTLNNNPTWINGKVGKGLSFDGTDDYVQMSGPALSTNATISGWFYYDTTGGTASLFRDNTSANGWILAFISSGTIQFRAGGTTFNTGITPAAYQNRWTHYAYTKEGSTVAYYLDGVQVYTSTGAANTAASLPWHIMKNGSAVAFMKGRADEVRVYNRALTPTEISALYNASGSKFGSSLALGPGTLMNGIVGHWTMDGADTLTSIADKSGQGNNGYFIGGATSSAKVAGKLGQTLSFDGINDYVSLSTSFGAPSSLSISTWFKTSSVAGEAIFGLSDTNPTATPSAFVPALAVTTGGLLRGEFWTGSTGSILSSGSVADGTWHHAVLVGSGTSQALYLDGVLVGSRSGTINLSWWTRSQIGTGYDSSARGIGTGWRYFDGPLDDMRVYNRALSAEEVKQLYTLGALKANATSQTLTAGTSLNSGLAGYWSFNGPDLTDSAVADRSGLANNGHFVGVATSSAKAVGKMGQGIALDGSDDQILVPDNDSLDPDTSDFAISLWAKSSNMDSGDALMLKTNGGGAGSTYGFHYGVFGTRQPTMHLSSGAAFTQIQSASSLTLGEWNHIVVTVDRDTMANTKIYINGVETTTNITNPTSNTGSISNSVPLSIGAESDGGFLWQGEVDEVRYYMRTLSAEEAKQLYLLGK